MTAIDFRRKFIFQRPYTASVEVHDEYDVISQFESDRGRIINSAVIRRLQQKTQVFPLERNAAVRSRLTHSLEVQQVGRHIAKEVLHRLQQQQRMGELGLEDACEPFESIVEMACLMHDIGNPPFGHFGESAINDWFARHLDITATSAVVPSSDRCRVACLQYQPGEDQLNELRCKVRNDLCHFDGNAQALRLVFTLQKLNLTFAQTACIMKYTRPAYWCGEVPKQYHYLMKKPGFYLAEEPLVKIMRQQVQLGEFSRFPLTYIMEAADDISYCIADLEDAVEKNIFSVEQLCHYLAEEWGEKQAGDHFDNVIEVAYRKMNQAKALRNPVDYFFMELRVQTVKQLVPHAAMRFIDNLSAIFQGEFNQALLEDNSQANRLLELYKNVARKYVFNHHEVEELELQGYRVISGLLDIYSPLLELSFADFQLLVKDNVHPYFPIATRLFHKLSAKHLLAYRHAMKPFCTDESTQNLTYEYYYRARMIQDYISGMTDLYAYDEYRRLMAAE
jgi:dGTPase